MVNVRRPEGYLLFMKGNDKKKKVDPYWKFYRDRDMSAL